MTIHSSPAHRFVLLRATRWFPTGLLIPVLVLLLIERGLTLGEIGLGLAAQGVVVFFLELPTGGLADSIGRRPVLLFASVIEIAAVTTLLIADTVLVLAGAWALMGVYRALESGPLDAWFVDTANAEDADADIERALGQGGAAIGIAIGAGSLLSAALVAWAPSGSASPLAIPLAVAIIFRLVDVAFIAVLMTEERAVGTAELGLRDRVRQVPDVIGSTVRLVRRNRLFAALIGVEFLWGFGLIAFESLFPPRLAEVTNSLESAASAMGPIVTAAWVVSALGAMLAPYLAKRIGTPAAAMAFHAVQGGAVIGMALVAGPVPLVALYMLTLGSHGAANPLYQALLHKQAESANRTTVISAASMAAQTGGVIGGIALGALADATSVSTAMIVGAGALLATVLLYLPAHRMRTVSIDHQTFGSHR